MMRRRALLAVTGALLALLAAGAQAGRKTGNPTLRFTFFALDTGTATLVREPGGKISLTGAGASSDTPRLTRLLLKLGVTRLDSLILTAWSEKQVGGASAIIRRFPTAQVLHSPVYVRTKSSEAFYLGARKREKLPDTFIRAPTPGEVITPFFTPPFRIRAVSPTGPMLVRFKDDPACGLVLQYYYDGFSCLDLSETTIREQKAFWSEVDPKPDGNVLVIGREGGADSLLPAMLQKLKTRVAVIPVPLKRGRAPAVETLAALRKAKAQVYRTDQRGTITVTTDGSNTQVTTER